MADTQHSDGPEPATAQHRHWLTFSDTGDFWRADCIDCGYHFDGDVQAAGRLTLGPAVAIADVLEEGITNALDAGDVTLAGTLTRALTQVDPARGERVFWESALKLGHPPRPARIDVTGV